MSGRLRFPAASAPEVSVLLVTFNARRWTERSLRALIDHTPPLYEVVVVDNASSDGTPEWLAEAENLTLVRNPLNRGFGPGCNQAAMWARGRHLVLLNSDALVHPGWLPPLLAILDGEPGVGAVASRLLNLDGSLQEAGSFLWRDGVAHHYGEGDDPVQPHYRFRRDVDYASAACLAVRRSAFLAAGGFDPLYAPAYCEDVDLCLRLWSTGLRTVYEPRSTATHVRWGSSGSRERASQLSRLSLPRFQRRWRDLLSHRPPHREPPDPGLIVAGRDIRCADRVLVVADRIPAPGRSAELLAELYPSARLTLLALDRTGAPAAAPPLLAAGVEVAWPTDPATWSAERACHYDAILWSAPRALFEGPIGSRLRLDQPQARLALDPSPAGGISPGDASAGCAATASAVAASRRALIDSLARAGVAPTAAQPARAAVSSWSP